MLDTAKVEPTTNLGLPKLQYLLRLRLPHRESNEQLLDQAVWLQLLRIRLPHQVSTRPRAL